MDRRSFIQLATVGGVAGVMSPQAVVASVNKPNMAGGLYYTKDAPGRWHKKIAGHLPRISKQDKPEGKIRLRITTQHGMQAFDHYIVKHILLDKDFKFINENMFDPKKDKAAISDFYLSNYQGPVYVLSVCNKHDTWMNFLEV